MLIDFSDAREANNWMIINDDVMGGVSHSCIEGLPSAVALFSGQLSLENNGGFASIRRRIDRHSLEGCNGVILKVKGDGRSYQFRVRTDGQDDGIAYRALFATDHQEWQVATLPFDGFCAIFRGRSVPGAPVLCPAHIQQIGILLADKRQGPFRLEIACIKSF